MKESQIHETSTFFTTHLSHRFRACRSGGSFKKGVQTVDMPPMKDRYEDQWREFAAVLNGEMVNPYTYEYDYLVHKCHLEACGLPVDV